MNNPNHSLLFFTLPHFHQQSGPVAHARRYISGDRVPKMMAISILMVNRALLTCARVKKWDEWVCCSLSDHGNPFSDSGESINPYPNMSDSPKFLTTECNTRAGLVCESCESTSKQNKTCSPKSSSWFLIRNKGMLYKVIWQENMEISTC